MSSPITQAVSAQAAVSGKIPYGAPSVQTDQAQSAPTGHVTYGGPGVQAVPVRSDVSGGITYSSPTVQTAPASGNDKHQLPVDLVLAQLQSLQGHVSTPVINKVIEVPAASPAAPTRRQVSSILQDSSRSSLHLIISTL